MSLVVNMESGRERIEKRNRPPMSCEPCRQRKLKCNRGLPCDTCVRRNKQAQCQYAANAQRSRHNGSSKQVHIRDKLRHLEDLVTSLATAEPSLQAKTFPLDHKINSETSNTDKTEAEHKEVPRAILSSHGEISYVDPGHWKSVLEEIREIREHLTPNGEFLPQTAPEQVVSKPDPGAAFMFGYLGHDDLDVILTSLPSQQTCDSLLAGYFNSNHTILAIIHPEQFRTQYQSFWAAPSNVDLLWLAQLFALLSIASSLRRIAKVADTSLPQPEIMQQRTCQCLLLGGYATADKHVLETLLLYLQSCFLTSKMSHTDLWLKMGHVVQLAFRMAYHRDPSALPNITVFEGEMRRRVWLNILQIDTLAAFQVGFPSMIVLDHCDTKVPGNYEYPDLHPDMQALPLPRPTSTRTPVLYTISKARVMDVFKKISQHTQSLISTTYDKTIALDCEMREAYGSMPELLKRRDISQSFMDSTGLIWDRCTIEILYLKGLIILHRRYIRQESGNPRYELSRRYCVEAALDMLARQADISQASQPGGRLYEDRWMLSSLTIYDFLLSSMIICLDLSVRVGVGSKTEQALDELATKELKALNVSHDIWVASSSVSPDARIAARTLDVMIKTIGGRNAGLLPTSYGVGSPTKLAGSDNNTAMLYVSPVVDMIDGTDPLDWQFLDQYFQTQGFENNFSDSWDTNLEISSNDLSLD